MQNKKLSGVLDSKLISVKEYREINSKLQKNNINIFLSQKIFRKIIIQILIFPIH